MCIMLVNDHLIWGWGGMIYLEVYLSVQGIKVLRHFHKNDLMPVIRFLTILSLFHVISIPFCPKTFLIPKVLKK